MLSAQLHLPTLQSLPPFCFQTCSKHSFPSSGSKESGLLSQDPPCTLLVHFHPPLLSPAVHSLETWFSDVFFSFFKKKACLLSLAGSLAVLILPLISALKVMQSDQLPLLRSPSAQFWSSSSEILHPGFPSGAKALACLLKKSWSGKAGKGGLAPGLFLPPKANPNKKTREEKSLLI